MLVCRMSRIGARPCQGAGRNVQEAISNNRVSMSYTELMLSLKKKARRKALAKARRLLKEEHVS